MRAAMAIPFMCHELGCLPVAKLCGLPFVKMICSMNQPQLLPDLLDQVEWISVAMKAQRDKTGNVNVSECRW